MSGGQKFEYLWADGIKYKKPTCLPASQYIALLMDWVETQINDEHVFPVTVGKKIFLNVVLIPYIQCKVIIYMDNAHSRFSSFSKYLSAASYSLRVHAGLET